VAILARVASAMPSLTLTGFTSSWDYKWIFGVAHSPVAITGIVVTLFPRYAAIFDINAAERDMQATDKKNFAASAAAPDPAPSRRKIKNGLCAARGRD
jgi:hypothetical protein